MYCTYIYIQWYGWIMRVSNGAILIFLPLQPLPQTRTCLSASPPKPQVTRGQHSYRLQEKRPQLMKVFGMYTANHAQFLKAQTCFTRNQATNAPPLLHGRYRSGISPRSGSGGAAPTSGCSAGPSARDWHKGRRRITNHPPFPRKGRPGARHTDECYRCQHSAAHLSSNLWSLSERPRFLKSAMYF